MPLPQPNINDLMMEQCKRRPITTMSRSLEQMIWQKIQAGNLLETFSQQFKELIMAAKEHYEDVVLATSTRMNFKSQYSVILIPALLPYKYLGRTLNYNKFLLVKAKLSKKWLLHYPHVRQILDLCVTHLPTQLCDLNDFNTTMELDEINILLEKKLKYCAKSLQVFHEQLVNLLKHQITSKFLNVCTGLVLVHIGQAIRNTLSYIVNFTNPKTLRPYLKLNIEFNEVLIVTPSAADIVKTFKRFLNQLIETAKQLDIFNCNKLPANEKQLTHIHLTQEFYNNLLVQLKTNIEQSFTCINKYAERLNETFHEIYLHIQPGYLQEIASSDLSFEEGRNNILYHNKFLNQIANIPDNVYFTIGTICLWKFRLNIYEGVQLTISSIFQKLTGQHFYEMNDINETFLTIHHRAFQEATTTEELIETGKYMTNIKEAVLESLNTRLEENITVLASLLQLGPLNDHHVEINSQTINWPQRIQPTIEEYFAKFDQQKFEAEEHLQKIVEDVADLILDVHSVLFILDDMDDISQVKSYYKHITLHMSKIKGIENLISWINSEEISLNFPKSNYSDFVQLKNYIYPFYHLLTLCIQIQRYLAVWLDGQFDLLVYYDISQKIQVFESELVQLQKQYRKDIRKAQDENISLKFRGTIDDPDLLNWPAPLKLCFKALKLIEDFQPYLQVIQILCNPALCSRHWQAMSKISSTDLTPNAGTTLRKLFTKELCSKLSFFEEISNGASKEKIIGDQLTSLITKWKTIHFSFDLQTSLLIDLNVINEIIDEQITILSAMRGSLFIEPHESDLLAFLSDLEKIKEVLVHWQEYQDSWVDLKSIFENVFFHEILAEELTLFGQVNKFFLNYTEKFTLKPNVLKSVLETEILVELNGIEINLDQIYSGIKQYLCVVRDDFSRFNFLSEPELIRIVSESTELNSINWFLPKIFSGVNKILVQNQLVIGIQSKHGEKIYFDESLDFTKDVSNNLSKLELSLRETLQKNLFAAFISNDNSILKNLQQTLTLMAEITWTSLIEEILSSNQFQTTVKLQKIDQEIERKFKQLKEELPFLHRHILDNLLLLNLNNRRCLKQLLENKSHFLWSCHLKYYFEENLCILSILNVRTLYGYEYLGNTNETIVTPLTERCFRILVNTYFLQFSAILEGFGKTSIVQNLAKAFGVLLVVFSTQKNLTYEVVSRFIKGHVKSECFLLLKNIKNLKPEILSIIGQDLWSAKAKFARSDLPKSFLCATNQTSSPTNFDIQFRNVTISTPDFPIIIEVTLLWSNFKQSKELTKKIVFVVQILDELCKLKWSLKTISRNLKRWIENQPINNEVKCVALLLKEFYQSKAQNSDVNLIIEDCLGVRLESCKVHGEQMRNDVRRVCSLSNANLDLNEDFLMQIKRVLTAIKNNNNVILTGPAFTGKSSCLRIAGLICKVPLEVLYVDCLTYNQLFGYYCKGKLTKGFFSKKLETQEVKWIVFDGQFPSDLMVTLQQCICCQSLCLESGERLLINEQKIIMETDNLLNLTPSFINSCAIVYFNKELNWNILVEEWIPANLHLIDKEEGFTKTLLNWAFSQCLPFYNQCTQILHVKLTSNFIRNVLQLFLINLEGAFLNNPDKKEDDKKYTTVWIQASLLMALIWGFGSNLDSNSRLIFDEFLKQLWRRKSDCSELKEANKTAINLPNEATLYEYFYVYKQKGSWKLWTDLLKAEKLPDPLSDLTEESLVISTNSFLCHASIIKSLIAKKFQVILSGPTDSGKSVLLSSITRNLPDSTTINLQPSTTPIQFQGTILSKLTKNKDVFSPSNGTLVCCIEDIHKANPTPSILDLLRQHLEHQVWPDLTNLTTIKLGSVYLTGSTNLVSSGHFSQRFLRHFHVFGMTALDSETIVQIYSQILLWRWRKNGFPLEIANLTNTLTTATNQVYNLIREKFKPSVLHPHYVFTIADFCKATQGLGQLKKQTFDNNKKVFLKMWVHEVARVFGDRLYNEEQFEIVISRGLEHLKNELDEVLEAEGTSIKQFIEESCTSVFGLSKENNYEELDLVQFKEDLKDFNIVWSHYAIVNLCKLLRLINMANNNAILLGLSGSGRQTLTKIACKLSGASLSQLVFTQNYNNESFMNDLKAILMKTGCYNENYVLLLEEYIESQFIEQVDVVMTTQDLSHLFTLKEQQEILKLSRRQAKGVNSKQVLQYFCRRSKESLHVFLCFNAKQLRSCIYRFPSLVNYNIIWFADWTNECLHTVAEAWLEEAQHYSNHKKQLPEIFTYIHRDSQISTNKIAPLISITTTAYIHMINLFNRIIQQRQIAIKADKDKYEHGLEKLLLASKQIEIMQKALANYQPQLEAMTKQASEMSRQIALDTQEVEVASAMVRKDEAVAHDQATVAQVLKLECEAELAQAIPILEDAISALNTLKPTDITLVKSMKNPPDAIKLVMAAVCVIKDIRPDRIPDPSTGRKTLDYWGPSKRILGEMNFLQSLKDFNKDNIKPELIQKIRREYLVHKDFKPNVVAKASSAAEGLCKWIIAMDMYDKVAKEVAPKKEKLEKAEREYSNTMAILNQKKDEVARIEEKLAAMNALLMDATKKLHILQMEVNKCSAKLQCAQKLIGGLAEEKTKWSEMVETLKLQNKCLVGDVLLYSSFMVYLSCFESSVRNLVLERWIKHVKEIVPVSPQYNFSDFTPKTFGDQDLLNNVTITQQSLKQTLLVDPQCLARDWIESAEKNNSLITCNSKQLNFTKTMQDSIKFSQPILIDLTNNSVPNDLYHLLQTSAHQTKIYLVTNTLTELLVTPTLCKLVLIVNFQISKDSLQNIFEHLIIETERPEHMKLLHKQDKQQSENLQDMQNLNEKILQTLLNSQSDILENDAAIKILDESKVTIRKIQLNEFDNVLVKQELKKYSDLFEKCAHFGTNLYQCIVDLSNLNFMYQFSLKWYQRLFCNSITDSRKSKCLKQRCDNIINYFIINLFKTIERGIFEEDKFLFSFLLASSVALLQGTISHNELNMFISGDIKAEFVNTIDLSKTFHTLLKNRFNHDNKIKLLKKFIRETMGQALNGSKASTISEIFNESYSLLPIIYILSPNINPCYKIEQLVNKKKIGNKFHRFSFRDSYETSATNLINNAQKEGKWILLENCHLVPNWLYKLEEIVSSFDFNNTHDAFRLWLTTESSVDFPVLLLQNSIKIIDEESNDFEKHTLGLYEDSSTNQLESFDKDDLFRKCLFQLSCFHAGLSHCGWNAKYISCKKQFDMAFLQLQNLISYSSFNIQEIMQFICESNYSQVMAEEWDGRLSKAYFEDCLRIGVPAKDHHQELANFVSNKVVDELQDFIGSNLYNTTFDKLLDKIQTKREKIIENCYEELLMKVDQIIDTIPNCLKLSGTTKKLIGNEMQRYNNYLTFIKENLVFLKQFLNGSSNLRKDFDYLAQDILHNRVPKEWLKIAPCMSQHLTSHLTKLIKQCNYFRQETINEYWLGAFYYPKSILCEAQLKHVRSTVDIENITFHCHFIDNLTALSTNSLIVTGLFVTGASWHKSHGLVELPHYNEIITPLPNIRFDITTIKAFYLPLYRTLPLKCSHNFITNLTIDCYCNKNRLVKMAVKFICQYDYK